jgi:hypothetical protein
MRFFPLILTLCIWVRLWSLVHTPPRQGSAVQQAVSKASTFWSALHDFARHDRAVPAKGWDEVGPDHPLLSVMCQIWLQYSVQKAMLWNRL